MWEKGCLTGVVIIGRRMKPPPNSLGCRIQENKHTHFSYLRTSHFLLFLPKMKSYLRPEGRWVLVTDSIESMSQGTEQCREGHSMNGVGLRGPQTETNLHLLQYSYGVHENGDCAWFISVPSVLKSNDSKNILLNEWMIELNELSFSVTCSWKR